MQRLQQALDFDESDLNANRSGHFSPAQKAKLQQYQARSLPVLWLMCLFVVAMLAIGLWAGGIVLAVFGMIALIGAVMALLEYLLSYQAYRRDLRNEVASIQGQLQYVHRGDTVLSIETHPVGIRVGDVSFLLLEHQIEAFHEGDIYIIYFAPRTNSLLSAETVMSYDRFREQEEFEMEENPIEKKAEYKQSTPYYTYMSKEEMLEKLSKIDQLLGNVDDLEGTRFSDDTVGIKTFSDEEEALKYSRQIEKARKDGYKEMTRHMQEQMHSKNMQELDAPIDDDKRDET